MSRTVLSSRLTPELNMWIWVSCCEAEVYTLWLELWINQKETNPEAVEQMTDGFVLPRDINIKKRPCMNCLLDMFRSFKCLFISESKWSQWLQWLSSPAIVHILYCYLSVSCLALREVHSLDLFLYFSKLVGINTTKRRPCSCPGLSVLLKDT